MQTQSTPIAQDESTPIAERCAALGLDLSRLEYARQLALTGRIAG